LVYGLVGSLDPWWILGQVSAQLTNNPTNY